MGSPRRTTTTGQKWFRGKMVNLITTSSIKKASAVHNKKKKTRRNNRKHRKIEK